MTNNTNSNNKKPNKTLKFAGIIASVVILAFSAIITICPNLFFSWQQIIDTVFANKTKSLDDQIVFLDVGQSDCTLIMSNGEAALVDLGNLSGGGKNITEDLKNRAIDNIKYLIITHYHADHMGAIETIAENFNIETVVINKSYSTADTDLAAVQKFLEVIENNNIHKEYATNGKKLSLGDFTLNLTTSNFIYPDENENCTIVSAECNSVKTLLMADAGKEMMSWFYAMHHNFGADTAYDILKVAHHGSEDSTTSEFLDLIRPKYAVISCGKNNAYGHPNAQVLNMLNKIGANVLRTDLNGDITVKITDPKTYKITTRN